MNRTIAYAYAKINLGLKVLGRRADGYHDILSIFQTIDLHDRLIFEPAARGATEILCDDPGIPAGRENLVFQAVEALREATGTENGIRVVLEKRIPVGAGLGGGSSDAAAVLRVLDGMWALRLSGARLEALAGDLGSDVPFFLRRGPPWSPGGVSVSGISPGRRISIMSWFTPDSRCRADGPIGI